MPSVANGSRFRQVLLETIQGASRNGSVSFNPAEVMRQTVQTLGASSDEELRQAILSYFNDLLRTGRLGLGDAAYIGPGMHTGATALWPHGSCHVTFEGQETLKHASRDPTNQPGYLAYIDQEAPLDDVTRGYVEEALNTYRTCCYKATAVLIGAAVESLVMLLRDELVKGFVATGVKPSKELQSQHAKTVLDAISKRISPDLTGEANKTKDPSLRQLSEDLAAHLPSVAAQFRKTRNEAGHPASLAPISQADVHCNLLLFPFAAKLLQKLTRWVGDQYK